MIRNKVFYILILLTIIYGGVELSSQTVIEWKKINQEVRIPKGEDYVFKYNLPKTNCMKIEVQEKGMHQIFKLVTDCIPPPENYTKQLPPDTLVISCDGELIRINKEKNTDIQQVENQKNYVERNIVWKSFDQVERVTNCEKVTFIYSGDVQPEEADFIYEQIEGGYLLSVKVMGRITELSFNCVCKRYEVTNPYSFRMIINQDLRFEQLIMTPMENNLWEVRVGSTNERNCKSPARTNLKNKRDANYEKKLPKNCN